MEKRTLTITEFCRLAGIGRGAAYEAVKRGTLGVPLIRIGRRILIPRAAAERLLEQGPPTKTTLDRDADAS